jgi:hypothetical protein
MASKVSWMRIKQTRRGELARGENPTLLSKRQIPVFEVTLEVST